MVSILGFGSSCPGFDSEHPQKFMRIKLSRLINSANKRKVDSGLKMMFEPN